MRSGNPEIRSGNPEIRSGSPDIRSGSPEISSRDPEMSPSNPEFTLITGRSASETERHDIVLNIRFDGNQLADFFKYIAEKSFSEGFSLADQNKEGSVRELPVKEKDSTPEIWINDETYLTRREVENMERLLQGWLNKEIADDLGLKTNTVRNHLQNVYPKLGVGNRSEGIVEYLKNSDKYKNMSSGK